MEEEPPESDVEDAVVGHAVPGDMSTKGKRQGHEQHDAELDAPPRDADVPSQKELSGLPAEAVAAFAARCAWRVFPIIGRAGNLEFWPDQNRERWLRSIHAALNLAGLFAIERERWESFGKQGLSAALGDTHEAASSAYSAGDIDAVDAAYVADAAHFAAKAVDGGPGAASAAAQMGDAIADELSAVRGSMQEDLEWLKYQFREQPDHPLLQGILIEFFSRPLWQSSPSTSFKELEDRARKVVTSVSPDVAEDLFASYNALCSGEGLQVDAAEQSIQEWLRFREPEGASRAQDPKSTPESVPPESAQARDSADISSAAVTSTDQAEEDRQQPEFAGVPIAQKDEPAVTDLLGREPLVKALAAMFASPQQGTPFTIGLLGDWGIGKTSVLRMVKNRLRDIERQSDREFDFAEFNAWEYEKTENLSAGLAQEVVRGLVAGAGGWWKRLRLAINFAWQEHGWHFAIWPLALIVAAALILLGIVCRDWITTVLPPFLQLPQQGEGGVLSVVVLWASLIGGIFYVLQKITTFLQHPLAVQLDTFLKLPDFGQHLGVIPVLRRHIDTLCRMRLGKQRRASWIRRGGRSVFRRLIVCVDDLDRCNPKCIVDTLDAVRLAMDRADVIVVIAIDHRIALQAVAEHYEELADQYRSKEDIARDYLGKIIQLPIRLHEPDETGLKNFVHGKLFTEAVEEETSNSEDKEEVGQVHHAVTSAVVDQRDNDDAAGKHAAASGQSQGLQGNAAHSTLQTAVAVPGESTVQQYENERVSIPLFATMLRFASRIAPREAKSVPADPRTMDLPALEQEMVNDTGERDLFLSLSQMLDVGNPRQLTRLRNSYRLLKVMSRVRPELFQELSDNGDPRPSLMRLLFWKEFSAQLPEKLQRAIGGALYKNELGADELHAQLPHSESKVVRQMAKDVKFCDLLRKSGETDLERLVESLILPRALQA